MSSLFCRSCTKIRTRPCQAEIRCPWSWVLLLGHCHCDFLLGALLQLNSTDPLPHRCCAHVYSWSILFMLWYCALLMVFRTRKQVAHCQPRKKNKTYRRNNFIIVVVNLSTRRTEKKYRLQNGADQCGPPFQGEKRKVVAAGILKYPSQSRQERFVAESILVHQPRKLISTQF